MYKFLTVEDQQARFRHQSSRNVGWVLLVVGGVMASAAVLVPLESVQSVLPILIGFAVIILASGVLLLTQWQPSRYIVLDGDQGELRFETHTGETTSVPLREFERVARRVYWTSGSNNRRRIFCIDLIKHDGTFIRLHTTHSAEARNRVAEQVEAIFQPSAPATAVSDAAFPPAPFNVRSSADAVSVEWPTAVRTAPLLGLTGLLVGIYLLGGGIMYQMHQSGGLSFIGWIIGGGLLALLSYVLGGSVLQRLASIGRSNQLHLSSTSVRYSTQGGMLGGLIRSPEWQLPYTEVRSISLELESGLLRFDTAANQVFKGTQAPEAVRGILNVPDGAELAPDNSTSFRFSYAPGELFVGDLPLGPLVVLEQWLQGQIGERTGRTMV